MALAPDVLDQVIFRFEREHDRYLKLAMQVAAVCDELVGELAVRATVTWRVKTPRSLRNKLLRPQHVDRYSTEEEVFAGVGDLAGVRVATYVEADRDRMAEAIEERFAGPEGAESPIRDNKDRNEPGNHYRATHCQVRLAESDLDVSTRNLGSDTCEIQVCSLLAHVFNEIEHDLTYKPTTGELSRIEMRLVDQLGVLVRAADVSIQLLVDKTAERMQEHHSDFVDEHDFVQRLRPSFFDSDTPVRRARDLFEAYRKAGIHTPESVQELVETTRISVEQKSAAFRAHLAPVKSLSIEGTQEALLFALLEAKGSTLAKAPPASGQTPWIVRLARLWNEVSGER